MTYVKHNGVPDLFITMTCNPNWQEITSELFPGKEAERPARSDCQSFPVEGSNIHTSGRLTQYLRPQAVSRLHHRVAKTRFTSRSLARVDGRENSSTSN